MNDIEKDLQNTKSTEEFSEIKEMISENKQQDGERSHSHSHHRHHSHGHHHSSGSSKNYHRHHSGKWSRFKKYVKKNKKKVRIICICAAIFVLFFVGLIVWGASQNRKSSHGDIQGSDDVNKKTTSSIIIETSFFEDDVTLVTEPVVEYINAGIDVPAADIYQKHKDSGRIDAGVPVTFSFDVRGLTKNVTVESSELYVAEDETFAKPTVYPFKSDKGNVSIKFLKTNTQYYYRVKLMLSNGTTTSTQGSFRTADTPRILSIDGIVNARDIGGWMTTSGKRIKQGLLYRGSELDGAVESNYLLTPEGMKDMLGTLGVRADLDLRESTDNKYGTNALGDTVEHIYYDSPMYSEIFADVNKEPVRRLFSDLANKDKYPIYLHCTYGLDRTGTMCYLLEGLLGVGDEDMMRDYQLSALCHGKVTDDEMEKFVNQLQTYPGATTQEKVENYLLSIGVTPAEIQSIRDIFLTE